MVCNFSIEGNIGAGKSTILNEIQKLIDLDKSNFRLQIMPEPVEKWCESLLPNGRSMLESYYEERKTNAFPFQMFVTLTHVQKYLSMDKNISIVTERSLESQKNIFAKSVYSSGILSDIEWHSYVSWIDALMDNTLLKGSRSMKIDGIIHLDVDPNICIERIQKRSRNNGEHLISQEMMDLLNSHQCDYIQSRENEGVPVLVVDGNADGDEALKYNARMIYEWMQEMIANDIIDNGFFLTQQQ